MISRSSVDMEWRRTPQQACGACLTPVAIWCFVRRCVLASRVFVAPLQLGVALRSVAVAARLFLLASAMHMRQHAHTAGNETCRAARMPQQTTLAVMLMLMGPGPGLELELELELGLVQGPIVMAVQGSVGVAVQVSLQHARNQLRRTPVKSVAELCQTLHMARCLRETTRRAL